MKVGSTTTLLFDQLCDLHSVESQLADALPKLSSQVQHAGLRDVLERHCSETEEQLSLLQEVCEAHEFSPGSDTCRAMAGLLKGGKAHLKSVKIPEVRDLMMIAHCLRIEQYEVAAYEVSLSIAEKIGTFDDIVAVLRRILAEERAVKNSLKELESEVFATATGASS
jgi:ferritin-like metal-binding protein YciE